MTATDRNQDHYLSIPDLMARWAVGRTSIYALARAADFPAALVLLWDKNGRPRSMAFLQSDIVAYEGSHRVHLSEVDLGSLEPIADCGSAEVETLPAENCSMPAAKRGQPRRKVA